MVTMTALWDQAKSFYSPHSKCNFIASYSTLAVSDFLVFVTCVLFLVFALLIMYLTDTLLCAIVSFDIIILLKLFSFNLLMPIHRAVRPMPCYIYELKAKHQAERLLRRQPSTRRCRESIRDGNHSANIRVSSSSSELLCATTGRPGRLFCVFSSA